MLQAQQAPVVERPLVGDGREVNDGLQKRQAFVCTLRMCRLMMCGAAGLGHEETARNRKLFFVKAQARAHSAGQSCGPLTRYPMILQYHAHPAAQERRESQYNAMFWQSGQRQRQATSGAKQARTKLHNCMLCAPRAVGYSPRPPACMDRGGRRAALRGSMQRVGQPSEN